MFHASWLVVLQTLQRGKGRCQGCAAWSIELLPMDHGDQGVRFLVHVLLDRGMIVRREEFVLAYRRNQIFLHSEEVRVEKWLQHVMLSWHTPLVPAFSHIPMHEPSPNAACCLLAFVAHLRYVRSSHGSVVMCRRIGANVGIIGISMPRPDHVLPSILSGTRCYLER